ncbi:hypothetical protein COX25_05205 [bacterium (Candidatus Howlettbacteria) CG23_combo_of_CG06-09_8_20_14_all_37_9]|nr:MAG: hypothetical protein COX25_05205 [bacterium (Candidatus Howlettbacteria) CG23_combo_of_CG06-09_8_20_14_all_37_9]
MSRFLEKVRPDLYVSHVSGIPFQRLYHVHGISGYIFDLDNTIRHKKHGLDPKAVSALREAVIKGYVRHAVVLSNTIQGEERVLKAKRMAGMFSSEIGINVEAICLGYSQRKPKIDGFNLALKHLQLKDSEVAMVGDQILSDIKGGNKAGLFTVLVDALGPYSWMSVISGRTFRNQWARWRLDL